MAVTKGIATSKDALGLEAIVGWRHFDFSERLFQMVSVDKSESKSQRSLIRFESSSQGSRMGVQSNCMA